MAIKLKNSIFLHIPKTYGRKITQYLRNFVHGLDIGDGIYAAHEIPVEMKYFGYFCFVRHPATFAHSLWYQRSGKKKNRFGHKWNWQPNRLEETCRSKNYGTFMSNVYNHPGIVFEYYNSFINSKHNMMVGRSENLVEDLTHILTSYDETFESSKIKANMNMDHVVGKGIYTKKVSRQLITKIEQSEPELMDLYYNDLHNIV